MDIMSSAQEREKVTITLIFSIPVEHVSKRSIFEKEFTKSCDYPANDRVGRQHWSTGGKFGAEIGTHSAYQKTILPDTY